MQCAPTNHVQKPSSPKRGLAQSLSSKSRHPQCFQTFPESRHNFHRFLAPACRDRKMSCLATALRRCSYEARMMDKKRLSQKVTILDSPLPGFVHKILANGLTVSTCLRCMNSIGSPTPISLRMAEENHLCELTRRPRKSR